MAFTTEEFPNRSFDDFGDYETAKKERERILRELLNPQEITVEISIEQQETSENRSVLDQGHPTRNS